MGGWLGWLLRWVVSNLSWDAAKAWAYPTIIGLVMAAGVAVLAVIEGLPRSVILLMGVGAFAFGIMIVLGVHSLVQRLRLGPKGDTKTLDRGLAGHLHDRRRERDASDRFVIVQPLGPDKSYARADLDILSLKQRNTLFQHDGLMEDWYRGRRSDGSWPMVRFDGGVWLTFEELHGMPEQERSALLKGFDRGVARRWYMDRLKATQ